jgi:BirA family biotin operon repressor/biotin-[acetyl-CoA-carboxylase] ligase
VSGHDATPASAPAWPAPFAVTWVKETGSTNADLLAAARGGAAHGTVLVADHQSSGRGRLGRSWSAPPGTALLCSILLRPRRDAERQGAVWAVGLAARSAVHDVAGFEPELKWPNDLLVGERKLAGILAESLVSSGESSADDAIVVGLGLNVDWGPTRPGLPLEVKSRAVSVAQVAGRPVERRDVLRALLARLVPLLDLWADQPDELYARYHDALATLGQVVRVSLPGEELEGEAVDLTRRGELVVWTVEGQRRVVSAGDVVHLR